jgi:hypothetical protein
MSPLKNHFDKSHGKWDDCDITFMITMTLKQKGLKCIKCMNKGMTCMMSPPIARSMTCFDIELKAFTMLNLRTTHWGEGVGCT